MRRFCLWFISLIFIPPILFLAFLLVQSGASYFMPPEKINYFEKFEAMVRDQRNPPEANGFRDLLQTLGPIALEENGLVERIAWKDITTYTERGQRWWTEVWIPYCESLRVDPYPQPIFLGYRPLETFIATAGITGREPPFSVREAASYAQHVAEYIDRAAIEEEKADEEAKENEDAEEEIEWNEGEAAWEETKWNETFDELDESICYRGKYGPIYGDWDQDPMYDHTLFILEPAPDIRYPDLPLPKLTDSEIFAYVDQLRQEPWTAEQNPQAAQWVTETSPLFDTLGAAARKPHYISYYPPCSLISIMVPDLCITRKLARLLMVRCNYRVGNGDIDGAIYDSMTLFHLARHLQQDPILVGRYVGMIIEQMANDTLRLIVHFGKPNSAQLASFQSQLESLPTIPNMQRNIPFEEYMVLNCVQDVYFYSWEKHAPDSDEFAATFVFSDSNGLSEALFNLFRPDLDTVRKVIHRRYTELQEIACDTNIPRRNLKLDEFSKRLKSNPPKGWNAFTYFFPLAVSRQQRSEWMGDRVAELLMPALLSSIYTLNNARSQTDVSRIGLALERFRLARLAEQADIGKTSTSQNSVSNDSTEPASTQRPTPSLLPKTLDELVEAGFLTSVPKDPIAQTDYVYQPGRYVPWQQSFRETAEGKNRPLRPVDLLPTEYLLYGVGRNGIDDTAKWNASHGKIPPDIKISSEIDSPCDDPRF
ncbi:MAG: hypothetical protein PHE53_04670 [Thermoguttaceae bacterium]|nr:hypothetical protein [Thermoguttaceae bacterium]